LFQKSNKNDVAALRASLRELTSNLRKLREEVVDELGRSDARPPRPLDALRGAKIDRPSKGELRRRK
jgi:hypothetical protein